MNPNKHTHDHVHEEGIPTISKRDFKKMLLPPIGTRINLEKSFCEVISHNTGKHRFSAWTVSLPPLGYIFIWEAKKYQVNYLMPEKKRFGASFIEFVQIEQLTPDLPEIEDKDVAKVI